MTAFDELHVPIVGLLARGDNFSSSRYASPVRRLTLIQDFSVEPDEHWRLFLDDEVERRMYLEGFRFPKYELLERRETDDEIVRKIRVVPRLDVPGAVAKLLGDSFGYTETHHFDKKTKVFRAKTTPSVLADRLFSESTVRVDAAGPGKCRRTVEVTVEAKIFGVGGLIETALEKNLRNGWVDSAGYLAAEAQKKR